MNLADMVSRKDYGYELRKGTVEPIIRSVAGKKMRVVKISGRAFFKINFADRISCLSLFPRFLDWKIDNIDGEVEAILKVDIVDSQDGGKRHPLCRHPVRAGELLDVVEVDWPMWAGTSESYRFEMMNNSDEDLYLATSYAFNPRAKIMPSIQGSGVEIGPGANPIVMPSDTIDIKYVETMPAEKWNALYNKNDQTVSIPPTLWNKYIVGDARELDMFEDNSIDFVFSNHVFEHLVNPLQVLENWSKKLKKSGVIIGVIPDCRYTFDSRQVPSTRGEWEAEYTDGVSGITMERYEKWCLGTAPYNTPSDLIERNYSIHVHYYSLNNFSELISLAVERGYISSVFYNTSPNNKDFGFVLTK